MCSSLIVGTGGILDRAGRSTGCEGVARGLTASSMGLSTAWLSTSGCGEAGAAGKLKSGMSLAGLRGDVRGLKADGVFGVFGRVDARDGRGCLAPGLKRGEVVFRGDCVAANDDVSLLP